MDQKDHFNKTYLYVCITTCIVLLYVIAITFLEIPEKNQRFVDIALAFLLGWLSSNGSYLTGGSPTPLKKPDVKADTVNAENVENVTTQNINNEQL